MKRLLIILVVAGVMSVGTIAAQEQACGCWLGIGGGAGYGVYCDQGTGPLIYEGLEARPTLSFLLERERWRLAASIPFGAGIYMDKLKIGEPSGYALSPEARVGAMWQVWDKSRWRVLAAVEGAEMFDFRYTPALGNNGTGTSNFMMLYAGGRGELDAGPWRFHTQLMVSPVGHVYRPGYAYIANYDQTMDNPVADHFSGHEGYLVAGASVWWHTGATLMLGNGNRLELAYQWHHLTSRTSEHCPHRFDRASHTLQATLLFSL